MTAPVFVDCNIFLYGLDDADCRKQLAARAWRSALWRMRLGRISFQVLHEFYVNAIRLAPSAKDQVRAEIRDRRAWQPLVIDAPVLELGWKLQDRYRLCDWDSLIVAAAKSASCGYVLSEDLLPGQKLDGIEVINPFLQPPDSLQEVTPPYLP